jgi:HK97 gp10 family phage protein
MVGGFLVTVSSDFGRVAEETRRRLGEVVREAAAGIEAQAKASAPVDTGALRNSIQASETGELSAEVAVAADYGLAVELGTARAAPRPYLGPGLEAARPELEAAVAAAVREALG